ncbi:hypothetical protein IEU95_11160 [Hoyosella rhizosphaerae]|nr:hypothetical protein [Hoyosella rhizosphaerae]
MIAGAVIVSLILAWGAWQRRWISDDGLIVLRTIRNLLAGNGPVFNAGERVEANTSTLWTYLVYLASLIPGTNPEIVVLVLALVLSVCAVVLAVLGGARLYANSTMYLVPAGVIAYIALPPARDFATSGLESGLVIAWIALLWWSLLGWARTSEHVARSTLGIAFIAGLGPLVRPELAVIGGLAIILLLLPRASWHFRGAIVLFAGAIPVLYQIFRMGYYGLPYPNTAVAKDAGGAKWDQGWVYLLDLWNPYLLWLPLVALAIAGVLGWWSLRASNGAAKVAGSVIAGAESEEPTKRSIRSATTVVVFFIVNAIILGLYVVRVGGDFMHGRTLLPVLFMLLLPVAVVPVAISGGVRAVGKRATVATTAAIVPLLVVVVWSGVIAATVKSEAVEYIPEDGIIDERSFYRAKTGVDHPIRAVDYLDYPRMRSMLLALETAPNGSVLLPTADEGTWFFVPLKPEAVQAEQPRATVFYAQLGMSSMLTPLDVRNLDSIGLSYPLAAHTERIENGRIGHDKHLYPDWLIADAGAVDTWEAGMVRFLDPEWVANAQRALECPQTENLLAAYRGPLTVRKFVRNIVNAVPRSSYRIDRNPADAIETCFGKRE